MPQDAVSAYEEQAICHTLVKATTLASSLLLEFIKMVVITFQTLQGLHPKYLLKDFLSLHESAQPQISV